MHIYAQTQTKTHKHTQGRGGRGIDERSMKESGTEEIARGKEVLPIYHRGRENTVVIYEQYLPV